MSLASKIDRGKEYSRGLSRVAWHALASPTSAASRRAMREVCRSVDAYALSPRLPRTPLTALVEQREPVTVVHAAQARWQVSCLELLTLATVAAECRPANIFEIGTFDGRTTLNLFLNAPGATVRTIDLPPERQRLPDGKRAGELIRALVAEGSIEQLFGDSTTFDFSPYFGRQNLVFVDAGHTYSLARNDTRVALRMLEGQEGFVFWHDYATWPGVTRAVEEIEPLVGGAATLGRVEGTTLAYLRTAPGEPLRLRSGRDPRRRG